MHCVRVVGTHPRSFRRARGPVWCAVQVPGHNCAHWSRACPRSRGAWVQRSWLVPARPSPNLRHQPHPRLPHPSLTTKRSRPSVDATRNQHDAARATTTAQRFSSTLRLRRGPFLAVAWNGWFGLRTRIELIKSLKYGNLHHILSVQEDPHLTVPPASALPSQEVR